MPPNEKLKQWSRLVRSSLKDYLEWAMTLGGRLSRNADSKPSHECAYPIIGIVLSRLAFVSKGYLLG